MSERTLRPRLVVPALAVTIGQRDGAPLALRFDEPRAVRIITLGPDDEVSVEELHLEELHLKR